MNNTLKVAVATDTILYAPFYLALYGRDFEDTPFGKLDINIIGQKGDMFFKSDGLPSKAVDGFVTLALLFDYADVGICDPSFLLDLYMTENFEAAIDSSLTSFIESLRTREKSAFYNRFTDFFDSDKNPEYSNIQKKLKEKFDIKVIGGLIQKIAFLVVSKKDAFNNDTKPVIGKPFFSEDGKNKIMNNNEKNYDKIISFPKPSTGYYIADSIAPENTKPLLYGEELSYIISDENTDDIALCCDIVSINKLSEKLSEHEDYINEPDNAMFTGIIANMGSIQKQDKYKAFLYALEKQLYSINDILENKEDNDLTIYFKNKLQNYNGKHNRNEVELISLLVADKNVEKGLIFNEKIVEIENDDGTKEEKTILVPKNTNELKESIEDLIYSYVQRLYKWKRNKKHLYYKSSVKIDIKDLQVIYKIRSRSDINVKSKNFKKFYNFKLLNKWNREDKRITKNHKGWVWRLLTNANFLLFFAAVFVGVETIGVYTKFFHIPPIIKETNHNKEIAGAILENATNIANDSFNINIHHIIISLIAFFIIYFYWKSHIYIKYNKNKKYAFDLNRNIPSKFYKYLNNKFPQIFKIN